MALQNEIHTMRQTLDRTSVDRGMNATDDRMVDVIAWHHQKVHNAKERLAEGWDTAGRYYSLGIAGTVGEAPVERRRRPSKLLTECKGCSCTVHAVGIA